MAKVTVGDANSTMQLGNRVNLRDSTGEVYIITTEFGGSTLEMFKGNNTTVPTSFTSQDTITGLTGLMPGTCAIAITSTDTIMCVYEVFDTGMGGTKEIQVVEYNTSTDTFGTPAAVYTLTRDGGQNRSFVGIACDANDDMHVVWNESITDMGVTTWYAMYSNNITSGGTTFKTGINVFFGTGGVDVWDIMIADPDTSVGADRPIICGYGGSTTLSLSKGNALNATSWSTMAGNFDVQSTAPGNIIKVESGANAGNLVVCGVDNSSLVGNVYSYDYDSVWVSINFNSSQSFNFTEDSHFPCLANKYDVVLALFVEEEFTDDIELWTKTGTFQFADQNSLSSDLPEVGTYVATRCKWAMYNNNNPDDFDYVFEDTGGLYYNSVDISGIGTPDTTTRDKYIQGYLPQVLF